MFQILILTCAIDLARIECQADKALDVVRGPLVSNELMCGMHGQAYLAQTSLAPRSGREYVKIQCIPTKNTQEAWQLPQDAEGLGSRQVVHRNAD